MTEGQTSVALSAQATAARLNLPEAERDRLLARLRDLAREPERGSIGVPGSSIRRAIFKTEGGALYNIVFAVDELMQQRARVPAIMVSTIKPLGNWRTG